MGALLSVLGNAIIAGLRVLFGKWKYVIGTLLVKTILAVVLYNLLAEVVGEILGWVVGKMGGLGGVVQGGSIMISNWSSLGAWICFKLKLPECFVVMITCVVLKWTLRKIPFVRW